MKDLHPVEISESKPSVEKRLRFRIVALLSFFGIYLAAYALLSLNGSYIGENLGGNDNRDIWYPKYCGKSFKSVMGRQHVRITAIGWVFFPPMLMDQMMVHRTHFNVDQETLVSIAFKG